MHVECAQNARRTAPLLRRVIAPPRLGVVFIAVLLEDHEQVVDVVLLLVLRVSGVGLLVRLQLTDYNDLMNYVAKPGVVLPDTFDECAERQM